LKQLKIYTEMRDPIHAIITDVRLKTDRGCYYRVYANSMMSLFFIWKETRAAVADEIGIMT